MKAWIHVLMRRDTKSLPPCLCPVPSCRMRDKKVGGHLQAEKRPPPGTESPDFSASQTVRNEFCCLHRPVDEILLWQPTPDSRGSERLFVRCQKVPKLDQVSWISVRGTC